MYEWDMERVSTAIKKQRELAGALRSMTSFFNWEPLKSGLREVQALWSKVFTLTPAKPHFQNELLDCMLQSPVLIATSKYGLMGTLAYDPDTAQPWRLILGEKHLEPTAVLPQYLVWCFPDREIKISLRRDAPTPARQVRFTVKGHSMLASSMPWYWIGYNMLNDVPFYNLWSMEPDELEFINWQDVLAVFDQIEEHFDAQNLVPSINLYDDE